jgi:hypothetical protein
MYANDLFHFYLESKIFTGTTVLQRNEYQCPKEYHRKSGKGTHEGAVGEHEELNFLPHAYRVAEREIYKIGN